MADNTDFGSCCCFRVVKTVSLGKVPSQLQQSLSAEATESLGSPQPNSIASSLSQRNIRRIHERTDSSRGKPLHRWMWRIALCAGMDHGGRRNAYKRGLGVAAHTNLLLNHESLTALSGRSPPITTPQLEDPLEAVVITQRPTRHELYFPIICCQVSQPQLLAAAQHRIS